MKNVSKYVVLFASVAFGFTTPSSAQRGPNPSGWGGGNVPYFLGGKGCTFYEHDNAAGQSWHVSVQNAAYDQTHGQYFVSNVGNVGGGWNDKISSINCDYGPNFTCWTDAYQHIHNDGGSITIRAGRLHNMGEFLFNDTISSMNVYCRYL